MNYKKLVLAMVFLVISFSPSYAAGFLPVANVVKIHGQAFINREKINEGAEVAEGMELTMPHKGDYIEIKFQNGHLVRLVGATVKVETLNPKNTLFNLLKGKIFSFIKPLTQDETFHVKTKRVAFAVRGTQFMIEEAQKQTYLCVCEGVVAAKSSKGEVLVKKDEDLTLVNSKQDLKAATASKNMADMTKQVFSEMGAH